MKRIPTNFFKGITITSFAMGAYSLITGANIEILQKKIEKFQTERNSFLKTISEMDNLIIENLTENNEILRKSLELTIKNERANETVKSGNEYLNKNKDNLDPEIMGNHLDKMSKASQEAKQAALDLLESISNGNNKYISDNFIDIIQNFFSTLNYIEMVSVVNLLGCISILFCVFSIFIVILSDYLIDKLKIQERFT